MSFAIFKKCSTFIEWPVKEKCRVSSQYNLHYLEDFLFGGKESTNDCLENKSFKKFCHGMGVPLGLDKTEEPTDLSLANI